MWFQPNVDSLVITAIGTIKHQNFCSLQLTRAGHLSISRQLARCVLDCEVIGARLGSRRVAHVGRGGVGERCAKWHVVLYAASSQKFPRAAPLRQGASPHSTHLCTATVLGGWLFASVFRARRRRTRRRGASQAKISQRAMNRGAARQPLAPALQTSSSGKLEPDLEVRLFGLFSRASRGWVGRRPSRCRALPPPSLYRPLRLAPL